MDLKGRRDIRDIFFDRLIERFENDQRIVLITVDMGAASFKNLTACSRRRFFNVGVSEANAISVSAGLSALGFIPVVYGITPFLVSRARAQLRHDISIGNRKIMLVGSGVGLTYPQDGPSHHTLDDIALIASLPGFKVSTPCNQNTTEKVLEDFFSDSKEGSVFVRLDKGLEPTFYESSVSDEVSNSAILRRSKSSHSIHEIVVTKTPDILVDLLDSKDSRDILYIHTIMIQNSSSLGDFLEKYKRVVVCDESDNFSGLSNFVRLALVNKNVEIVDKSSDVKFIQEKYSRRVLRAHYNMSRNV